MVDKVVFLDDFTNPDSFKVIVNGPLWHLYPLVNISEVYKPLSAAARAPNSHFKVWLHDKIPAAYHYKSDRVGPIVLLPDYGYNFAFRKTFDPLHPPFPKGVHGWNITHPDMQAILIGSGPYFKDYPKRKKRLIKNVELYGMLADILKIKPNPNNGTGLLIK